MLVAGLLSSDQLAGIFLNVEELIRASACFAESLGAAVEAAAASGDAELSTVAVGAVFADAMFMLRAYESYCTRQVRLKNPLSYCTHFQTAFPIFIKNTVHNPYLRIYQSR